MTTYTIKPYAATSGSNGASIYAILGTINTKLQTDDVTLNCYRGGNVAGVSAVSEDGSVAIFSTVAGRKLIVNFVDPPPVLYKQFNNTVTAGTDANGAVRDGRYYGSFFIGTLRLRVADVTLNNYYSAGGTLSIEANSTGDNDIAEAPMNNGGVTTVVCAINDGMSMSGALALTISTASGTLAATVENFGITDGPIQLELSTGSTMTLDFKHVGCYGNDGGLAAGNPASGSTLNITATNSVFAGDRGLFSTAHGTNWGTATHNETYNNCIPSTTNTQVTALGYSIEGEEFIRSPHPGSFGTDMRPLPGSPLIRAGTAGILDSDGAGRDRRILGNTLGPVEPDWYDVPLVADTLLTMSDTGYTVEQSWDEAITVVADGIALDLSDVGIQTVLGHVANGDVNRTTATTTTRDAGGAAEASVTVFFDLIVPPTADASLSKRISAVSDEDGSLSVSLLCAATYAARRQGSSSSVLFTTDDSDSYVLPQINA